jgi:hypothetical protein
MLLRSLAILTLLALPIPLAPIHPPQDDARPTSPEEVIAGMDWLAGTWSGDMWSGRFVAHYSTPEGGKVLSHSKLMKGDQEAFYEFELFEARDGQVFLQPFPGGRKADGFLLQSHDPKGRVLVFENPDKDYPTRIVYERPADDELVITLTDPHGESEKVERFALSR